ncbi:MAG TPA: hypothetical protein VJS44_07795 [Pyrinomonadaceae bacterium]|nr:hypothetical protein [Pyrinomonadaceae bacterium]
MSNASRNRALLRFVLLPLLLLTVALLGGLRVSADDHAFIFVAPPLITLVLSVLLMLLFVRGRMVELRAWVRSDYPVLVNVSHTLTLLSLFFASAQTFNSVLPESGLLFWLFSFFFLWTLWNNQFSNFDARHTLRSLTVLFGTAFALKHLLLSSIYAPEGSWLRKLAGLVLEGVSLGTLDAQRFAPATGYISFFTLALYVTSLILLSPQPEGAQDEEAASVVRAYQKLGREEQRGVRAAIEAEGLSDGATAKALPASKETVDAGEEETVVSQKTER